MKKVLAFILSLAMLLSMSVTAFADGVETTVITDANSDDPAVQSWKRYYSGTGQMQMEPTFKAMLSLSDVASMEKYGDLDQQQFGVVKFSSGSGYKVRFSTSSTENITGYVGEYGSTQMPAWVPLAFSYNTQNMHATGGVSTVISSGDPVTLDLSFPGTYGQVQNGAVYIGFALSKAPTTDVSVTVTLLKKTHDNEPDEEIGSAVLNFTAASQQSEQTVTVAPTAVTIGGTFSDIIGEKTYRLHLNAGMNGEYRTAMNLIASLIPANATGEVEWSSANENIVAVSAPQNNSYGATVTAVGAGETTVTATIKGTSISDTITVKVFGKTAATVGDKQYETLADALEDVGDNFKITVDTAMTIGNVPVAAGSTITATNSTEAAVTNNTATVTPKTLTISKNGEENKTAKAYVVSSGSGDYMKSAVVTDVKFAGNSNITKGAGASVENYVNVAQVLANAVAANATGDNAIDVSSISSMTLRLDKTDDTASVTLTGNESDVKTALQSKLNNTSVTVYDVKPIATVTTATTTGTTTSTKTYEYDASKEVTGEFKFKLHVSDNSTDVAKTANLTHYHEDNDGTWTATKLSGIVDSNGDVTVTLNQFSYISVDNMQYNFPAAVAAANPGDTIKLLEDVTLTDSIDIDKELTIDLNGHSITESSAEGTLNSGNRFSANTANTHDYLIGAARGSNLTIIDSTGGGAITSEKLAVAVKLTVYGENDATTAANVTVGAVNAANNFTIQGRSYGISGNGTRHNANLTVYGGTITAASATSGTAIYFPQEGTLTISGGTMTAYNSGVELRSGTLNVTGGTFTATSSEYACNPNGNGTTTKGVALVVAQHTTEKTINANITGGTYNGLKTIAIENPQGNDFDNVTVSGSASLLTGSIVIPKGYEWVTANGVSTLKKSFVSTLSDKTWDEVAWIHSANLTLLDTIQLNAYLFVPQVLSSKASYVTVTFNGTESAPIYLNTLTKDNGYYPIHQKVYAAQMDYRITITLYDTDGEKMDLYQAKWGNDTWQMWELESQVFTTSVNIYLDKLAAEMTAEVNNSLNSEAQKAWAQAWYDFAVATKEYGAKAVIASSKGLKKPTT